MTHEVNRTTVLLITTLASFLSPFMASSINVALPVIASELTVNAILLGWIPTAFLLTSAMLAVPFGRVADIYGMKRIFLIGITIFTISSFLSAISPSVEFLILSRMIQGIGSAMIFVTAMVIITSVFHQKDMGKAIGLNITSIFLGLLLGPVIGGLLTQYLGWRSIFYLAVPLGLFVVCLVIFKFKEMDWSGCNGEKMDIVGSILYSFTLLMVLAGFSEITLFYGKIMVSLGIFGLIYFVYWELRVEHPILDLRIFIHNRKFAFSNLASLISFISTFSVIFLLSFYLQYIKGLTPVYAGMILAIQTVAIVLMTPVSGRLSDKIEARTLASIGMGIITVGLIILTTINMETSIYLIIFVMILLGIGIGLFATPNTHAIMSSVEKKDLGVAAASASTMRLAGQALGMGMVLVVFSFIVGAVEFGPQNYSSLMVSTKIIFMISSLFGLVAIIMSISRGKTVLK
jgi:EmrB/QacA subfamily drug resistance transporter